MRYIAGHSLTLHNIAVSGSQWQKRTASYATHDTEMFTITQTVLIIAVK